MMKRGALIFVVSIIAFVLSGCSQTYDAPPQANEDEIKLKMQLDLKENIGLLLINYDANGSEWSGGVSNADKSMIKRDDILYWAFDKQQLDHPANAVNLTVQFTVVTEYCDPNYDNIYPEEYMIPMDAISWRADFGETYLITISGDKTNGYQAVLGS